VIKIKKDNLQTLFFLGAIVLFYLLLQPLLNIFLASIILTYVFYPLYKKISKSLKSENLSVLITLILIVIIFLMPFVFVASQIPKQATSIYNYAKENIIGTEFFDINCEDKESTKCNAINFITGSGYFNLGNIVNTIFKKITAFATYIVVQIPNIIASIALALFISFFLFKDGKKMINSVSGMIPLQKKYSNNLIDKFGQVTHSVVFAHLIVAIVQGVLGAVGFYIFGLESAIFWGVVMAIFALIPLIGPAIIWLPAAIFIILNGLLVNSYFDVGKGIGLILYGIFIIGTSDNILRVKLIGGKGDVHPLTVLVGIIGGLNLFGLIGIFVGPIALSLLITFFKDFNKS
jgi:predicted PurR-regulated permease PerM